MKVQPPLSEPRITAQRSASCADVAAAADAILAQCEQFVAAFAAEHFTGPSNTLKGGTVGKHIRHTLDHFAAALAGVEDDAEIDYDRRQRDVPVEVDPAAAARFIGDLRSRLSRAASHGLDTPVRIRVMLSADGAEAVLTSSFGRELAFATHHAVHHQAMMKAIAAEFGVDCDECFGRAPSTLNHERKPAR